MNRFFVIIVLLWLLAIIESIINTFFSDASFLPYILINGVIFIAINSGIDIKKGVILCFLAGYFLDLISPGTPILINGFCFVVLYLILRTVGGRIFFRGTIAYILFAMLSSFFLSIIMLAIKALFLRVFPSTLEMLKITIVKSFITAIIAPSLFYILTLLSRRYKLL